jgi:hypothetical protein
MAWAGCAAIQNPLRAQTSPWANIVGNGGAREEKVRVGKKRQEKAEIPQVYPWYLNYGIITL